MFLLLPSPSSSISKGFLKGTKEAQSNLKKFDKLGIEAKKWGLIEVNIIYAETISPRSSSTVFASGNEFFFIILKPENIPLETEEDKKNLESQ